MEEGFGANSYDRMTLFLASKVFMQRGYLTKPKILKIVDAAPFLTRAPQLWDACGGDVEEFLTRAKKEKRLHKKRRLSDLSTRKLSEFFGNK